MKSQSFLVFYFVLSACTHAPITGNRDPQTINGSETEKDKRIAELRNQAHSHYKRGDYLRSIPYLEGMSFLGDSTLDSDDKFVLGYSYLSVGESQRAEEAVRSGIKLSPYRTAGYQLLGLAMLAQGKVPLAIDSFKKGLEFDSHPPKMHYYLGLSYEKLGKTKDRDREFQNAQEEYEQILLQNVYDFGANFELAYLYLTLGHGITKVDELIENALAGLKDSDPELVEGGTLYQQFYLPLLQGLEAYRKNELSKARGLLNQAALSSPLGSKTDLAEIYKYLAASEKEAGRPEASNTYLEMSKALDPFDMLAALR